MKRMLITGTTRGIGNCLYERYKDMYEVTTINRRQFLGNNIVCDLSNMNEVEKVAAILKGGEYDIVINNAGGASPLFPEEVTSADLVACSNLNYHSPVMIMLAALEGMSARGYGRVVNISSIASKGPRELLAHYGAAKSALEKFTTSMAVYYGNRGITINSVCPGGVATEASITNRNRLAVMTGVGEGFYNERFSTVNGLGRMILPEEIASLIDFLISDSANAISGQVLNICGVAEVH